MTANIDMYLEIFTNVFKWLNDDLTLICKQQDSQEYLLLTTRLCVNI